MSIEYTCKKCDKKYSTYKSLWRHDALKHKTELSSNNNSNVIQECPPNVIQMDDAKNEYKCLKCKKIYKYRQGLWKHEQKCKETIDKTKDEEILEIKKVLEDKNKKELKMEKEMENLKTMLQKALKIHPKTLNKINNQLNNHGTINNITIIQLGSENLSKVLNDKQKRFILDRQAMSLNHLVDLIHVSGKYKKFQNVYITNLQSTFAYRFDEKLNKFIAVNKNELLTDIVDSRMYDIQKFYAEIYPELEPRKAEQIKKFIDRMGNEEDELKDIKKEEIKLILYNNREKILTKDAHLENVIVMKDEKNIDLN